MSHENIKWIETAKEKPPQGVIVLTKIDDENGVRNEGKLKLRGGLWFVPSGEMYVYYSPTHWAAVC